MIRICTYLLAAEGSERQVSDLELRCWCRHCVVRVGICGEGRI